MTLRALPAALSCAILVACSAGDSPTDPPDLVPSAMTAVGPAGTGAVAGSIIANPPSVKVTTSSGAAVPGITVSFVVTAGGGSVSGGTVVTSASGIATVGSWTLGPAVGANTLSASTSAIPGVVVTFDAMGSAGAPASLSFSRDSLLLDQWGDTGSVSVTARDANANVISNPTVEWTTGDAAVATIAGGLASGVRAGRTLVQVTATAGDFPPIQASIPVRVVTQRNLACVAPVAPARGAVAPAAAYGAAEIQGDLTVPSWDGARSIAFDLDDDGDDDVVRFEYSYPSSATYSGEVRVFKNDGGVLRDSTAALAPAGLVPNHPRDFEVADFDADGRDELLLIQHGYDAIPFPGTPDIMLSSNGGVLTNVADARFAGMSASGFGHGSSTADIDCDGDLDVVELQLTSAAGNRLWINSGGGSFTNGTDRSPPLLGTTGQRWQEAAFIDFDGDGDPDLYLGARSGDGWNEDQLLVNDGFGNFRQSAAVQTPAPRFASAHGINNAKSADFNGDGREDLVLFEIPEPFSASSAARLWLNSGDGSFTDASTAWGLPDLCSDELIEPLYVRDMNGDGWPDVILPSGCPELGGSGILTNTGAGFSMMAFSTIEPWLENAIVTPVDLSSDDRLDLFFGERGGNPVVVRQP